MFTCSSSILALYCDTNTIQCSDIQFSSDVTYQTPSACTNNTNLAATAFPKDSAARNANESTAEGQAQSGSSSSSTSKGAAVPMQTAAWGVIGAALVGGIVAL
jgi:hypothetical protein